MFKVMRKTLLTSLVAFSFIKCGSSRSEIDESLHNQSFEKFARTNELTTDLTSAQAEMNAALAAPGISNILQSRKPTKGEAPTENLVCPSASLLSFLNRLHLQCWTLPDGRPRWVTFYAEGLAASDTFDTLFIQYRNHSDEDPQTYFVAKAESYLEATGIALGATRSDHFGWLTLLATNPRAGFLIDVLIAKSAKLGIAKTMEASDLEDFGEALRKEAESRK